MDGGVPAAVEEMRVASVEKITAGGGGSGGGGSCSNVGSETPVISFPLRAESINSLLETSKTPQGRTFLAATKSLVPELLLQLPSDPLSILRLLRNLCAGEPSNLLSFVRSHGPLATSSLVLSSSSPLPVVKVGLQLLANVSCAAASTVWGKLFPHGLLDVVLQREDAGVLDAMCMILYTCCFSAAASGEGEGVQKARSRELRGVGTGVELVAAIVRAASIVSYRGDWLQLLLPKLCFEETCFPQLFGKLGFPGASLEEIEIAETAYTVEQSFLLGILSEILEEQPYRGVICINFVSCILRILMNASAIVDFTTRGSCSLPSGYPAIDALGFSLLILKNICALDSSSSPIVEDAVTLLLSSGICQLLLELLRDLEPPLIIRRSISQGQNEGLPSSVVKSSSKVLPYKGFRRDIVAVIGNCMFGRKDVQDEIRRQNGVLLLLQQCVVDDENPFLREWGIWTIRCLLDGNPENQKEVAELEIQGSLNTHEVAELGMRVEIDRESCRAKLVNMS